MKELFDKVAFSSSKITTTTYSTSFSLGIYCLSTKFHKAIYSIYGFVRFADEIVDTFHVYKKEILLKEFKEETYKAIDRGISLNPILNSFQLTVNHYNIDIELVETFFNSMEMDLNSNYHTNDSYKQYILGSAEVVGLMCLRVFAIEKQYLYEQLKPAAIKLGAAFQKVNFLRDLKSDYIGLGRIYFPNLDLKNFTENEKNKILVDIETDFNEALQGIKKLPVTSKFGVYVAYIYYKKLFDKIKRTSSNMIMSKRIRISNYQKIVLLVSCHIRRALKLI